ncbi:MAG: LysR substrate-binding domain-containing protein [Janthinobacterium sp.]
MGQFRQISTFVEVVAKGSLSAAARAEGIAPAMIGRRLDALEQRLGVKLLQRTTRKLALTNEGAAFLEDCQRILGELEEAEAAVAERSVKASGHLLISAPAGFGRQHVAPLIPSFVAEHRDVTVSLNLNDRRVDLVAEGIDVAIRVRPPPLPDSDLVLRVLAERSQCMVGSPLLFAGAPLPQAPADLADWPSLALGTPQQQYQWDLHGPDGARAQLRHTPRFVTGDMLTLRDAAVAGVGVVQLPTMMITAQVADGSLLPLMAQWRPQREIIHAVFPSRRGLLPAVRALIDHLAHGFAALEEE